jgi:hypothetical protein
MSMCGLQNRPVYYDKLEKPAEGYFCGDQHVVRCQNDEVLAFAYSRFKREGLLPILFYEHQYTLLQFVAKYIDNNTSTLACFQKVWNPLKQDEFDFLLCGIGWINDLTNMGPDFKRANCGMAFFRGFSKPNFLVRFAHMMIEWAFDHLDIDALHGITPAKNRAAVLFSKKCGFQVVGPLEAGTVWNGELCDVYMSAMTIKRWVEVRPWGCDGNA